MIPVKVQCGCGQRYAFDVEPVNGGMPSAVACPVCGADGTMAANAIIAQALAAQPTVAPTPSARLRVQPPAVSAIAPAAAALAVPVSSGAHSVESSRAVPPVSRYLQTPSLAKDGWDADESSLNKLGTFIIVAPAGVGALLLWGIFGITVPPMILWIVAGVCGLIGGALNVLGRGPILAGAVVGVVVALGGLGAVSWWIQDRKSVFVFEVMIAFMLGAAPGILLQKGIQVLLRRRAQAQE